MEQYINNSKYSHYSLPTMMANFIYINPTKGMMKDQATRTAVMNTIDVDQLVKQTYFGRGKVGAQMYPPYTLATDYGKQVLKHDPSALTKIAASLPADQKSVTIGYDTSNPDNQLITNLIQTQLAAAGLTVKVQGYPDIGDLRLGRQRCGSAGDLRQLGVAGRSVAVHLGSHLVGSRRRYQLPELLVAKGHRCSGARAAERCAATVFGRGRRRPRRRGAG